MDEKMENRKRKKSGVLLAHRSLAPVFTAANKNESNSSSGRNLRYFSAAITESEEPLHDDERRYQQEKKGKKDASQNKGFEVKRITISVNQEKMGNAKNFARYSAEEIDKWVKAAKDNFCLKLQKNSSESPSLLADSDGKLLGEREVSIGPPSSREYDANQKLFKFIYDIAFRFSGAARLRVEQIWGSGRYFHDVHSSVVYYPEDIVNKTKTKQEVNYYPKANYYEGSRAKYSVQVNSELLIEGRVIEQVKELLACNPTATTEKEDMEKERLEEDQRIMKQEINMSHSSTSADANTSDVQRSSLAIRAYTGSA